MEYIYIWNYYYRNREKEKKNYAIKFSLVVYEKKKEKKIFSEIYIYIFTLCNICGDNSLWGERFMGNREREHNKQL